MGVSFSHDIELEVPVPISGTDEVEWICIDVRLNLVGSYSEGSRDYFSTSLGCWQPGDDPEADYMLTSFEVGEYIKSEDGRYVLKWRDSRLGCSGGDDGLVPYIEAYMNDEPEKLIEDLRKAQGEYS